LVKPSSTTSRDTFPGNTSEIAMPAKVGRHDMKVRRNAHQMIPTAGMIETAMNQEQWRGLRGTAVGEMKP
jgi:hypothetical protein